MQSIKMQLRQKGRAQTVAQQDSPKSANNTTDQTGHDIARILHPPEIQSP